MAIMPLNQFSILAGPSGCGKTTLLMQAWALHEKGLRAFPILFDEAIVSCGMILADRTKAEAEERAKYLKIERMEIYGLTNDHSLSTKAMRNPENLWKQVMERFKHQHKLMFIDPIGLFMEGSLIDYKSVAASLIRFNRHADLTSTTMVGVHHTTKSRSDWTFKRPQDRISGSGAFPGYSSTQCMMIESLELDKPYDKLVIVPHMTPKEDYCLVRMADGYFTVIEDDAKTKALDILNSLTDRFMKLVEFKQTAIKHGLSETEVDEWIDREPNLKVSGEYIQRI